MKPPFLLFVHLFGAHSVICPSCPSLSRLHFAYLLGQFSLNKSSGYGYFPQVSQCPSKKSGLAETVNAFFGGDLGPALPWSYALIGMLEQRNRSLRLCWLSALRSGVLEGLYSIRRAMAVVLAVLAARGVSPARVIRTSVTL